MLIHFEWWRYERRFGKKLSSYREIRTMRSCPYGTPLYLVPSFLTAGTKLKGIVYSICSRSSTELVNSNSCWNHWMKPKYSTKKSLLFRVTPTLKHCLTQFLTYLYVPDSGSPLPGTVPPPPVVWVGRWVGGWVGGEVEHEVEGISEKWWMLAPDE